MNGELEELWPDFDRRDAALQRIGERLAGRAHDNSLHYRRIDHRVRQSETLTKREQEIIVCLSHGLGRRGAADVLGITVETVKQLLQNAKRRVGAKDNIHLVAIAMREGVIP